MWSRGGLCAFRYIKWTPCSLLLPQIKLPRELHHAALSSGNPDLLENPPSATPSRAHTYLQKVLGQIKSQRVAPECNISNVYNIAPMWQYSPPRHIRERRRYTDANYHYDANENGSFPPRLSTLDEQYAWIENDSALYDEHPLAWIPDNEEDMYLVQSIHYLQSEHNPIKQVSGLRRAASGVCRRSLNAKSACIISSTILPWLYCDFRTFGNALCTMNDMHVALRAVPFAAAACCGATA